MDVVRDAGAPPIVEDSLRLTAVKDLRSSLEDLSDAYADGLRQAMDDVAELAGRIIGTPIALVTIVDADEQVLAAGRGHELTSMHRSESFCAWAILEPDQTMVVSDATSDPRFVDNPSVLGDPHIRFYAGRPFRNPAGQPIGALCVIDHEPRDGLSADDTDALERLVRQLEAQLHLAAVNRAMESTHRASASIIDHERRFLQAVLDNLDDSVVACDASGTLTVFNPAAREVHGLPAEPIPAERWAEHYDLYRADGRTPLPMEEIPLFRALAGKQVCVDEIVIAPRGRRARRMSCHGQQLTDAEGDVIGAVVAMHDITVQRDAEMRLRHMADHDPLTGMPNRNALQRRLDALIATRGEDSAAVLFLDLDGFKAINDVHGHVVGDRVLTAVADRIRGVVDHHDVIARLGGDEFVVVRPGADHDEAADLARQLGRAVERPLMGRGALVDPRASIGLAMVDQLGTSSVDMIMDLGDRAMYTVKRQRRSVVLDDA